MTEISFSLQDIEGAAAKFVEMAQKHHMVTLQGTMGAGKTTFVSAICREMGVSDAVSSPTFALVNEYHYSKNGTAGKIFHIDLYRVKDEEEAVHAGMEDCFLQAKRGEAYCFVEWPERAPNLLRMPKLEVSIEITGESERTISLKPVS
ncbi:MAG: tRNA (adenosine(37)-N6)-threonylcarbamoyltransferase complex ATPase subunit type 1 TsaE [Taibaiella sp.]|nr:tRNA (adenosine(37)-N6)-threonylcarbamoyltransferase complex ATPase subunit type 1 TsaE [Taibaiella sp.]